MIAKHLNIIINNLLTVKLLVDIISKILRWVNNIVSSEIYIQREIVKSFSSFLHNIILI